MSAINKKCFSVKGNTHTHTHTHIYMYVYIYTYIHTYMAIAEMKRDTEQMMKLE